MVGSTGKKSVYEPIVLVLGAPSDAIETVRTLCHNFNLQSSKCPAKVSAKSYAPGKTHRFSWKTVLIGEVTFDWALRPLRYLSPPLIQNVSTSARIADFRLGFIDSARLKVISKRIWLTGRDAH